MRRELDCALRQCDMLVGPSTPGPAFRLGTVVGDPLAMYKADMTTVALNLAGAPSGRHPTRGAARARRPGACCRAGLPAVSVPCGFATEGGVRLPLGLQIIGRAFGEGSILRCAHAFQQTADFAWGQAPAG